MTSTHDILQSAHEKTASRRAELTKAELASINLDIESAYSTVIRSLPGIRSMKELIAKTLPTFDLEEIERLEDYACAMEHSHHLFQIGEMPAGRLAQLNEQATASRDRFSTIAHMFAKLGIVSPARLAEVKGLVGYRNIANDLDKLSLVLRDSWSAIEGKAPITIEDIADARALAKQLADAAALRDQAPTAPGPAAEDRLRAYTLFVRTYDEIRWALAYVRRHEGDADEIAPSLYAGRGGRGRKSEAPPPPVEPAHVPTPTPPPVAAVDHPSPSVSVLP